MGFAPVILPEAGCAAVARLTIACALSMLGTASTAQVSAPPNLKLLPSVELTLVLNGPGDIKGAGAPCKLLAGQTSATCSRTVNKDKPITVTATPAPKMAFVGWAGACSGNAPSCTFTPTGSSSLAATFGPALQDDTSPWVKLAVGWLAGPVPAVQAKITTEPNLPFQCLSQKDLVGTPRTTCVVLVKRWSTVALSATLTEIYPPPIGGTPKMTTVTGKGFGGDCYTKTNSCTLTMSGDKTVWLSKN